jgi:CBS domain-containing protein
MTEHYNQYLTTRGFGVAITTCALVSGVGKMLWRRRPNVIDQSNDDSTIQELMTLERHRELSMKRKATIQRHKSVKELKDKWHERYQILLQELVDREEAVGLRESVIHCTQPKVEVDSPTDLDIGSSAESHVGESEANNSGIEESEAVKLDADDSDTMELNAEESDTDGSISSDFLHVMCYDNPCEPTTGLARHLLIQAGDLPYDRVVASIDADSSVQQALALLAKNRSSCVRVDRVSGSCVMDVIDATVVLLQPHLSTIGQPVGSVTRLCASVGPSLSMQFAVQYLKQGYDYLTVRGREEGILSQAGVLRWIKQFLTASPEYVSVFEGLTAGDIANKPMTWPADATARSALHSCLRNQTRSLALVDVDTHVVSVLSLSDIKCLAGATPEETMNMLSGSAFDFVLKSREVVAQLWDTHARPIDKIVHARADTPILDILGLVVTEDVHCIYILDGRRCTGVISTLDLLNYLV